MVSIAHQLLSLGLIKKLPKPKDLKKKNFTKAHAAQGCTSSCEYCSGEQKALCEEKYGG